METNVYYRPEVYGLEIVGEAEMSEPDWSFDTLAVWKGASGYYLGTDSGCSCPSPFESYGGIEDLTGPLTATEAREEVQSLWEQGGRYDEVSFGELLSVIT